MVGSLDEDLGADPRSSTHVNFMLTRKLVWPKLIISKVIGLSSLTPMIDLVTHCSYGISFARGNCPSHPQCAT